MPLREHVQGAQAGREGAYAPRLPVLINNFVVSVGDIDEHVELIKGKMLLFEQVPGLEEVQLGAVADCGGVQYLGRLGLQRLAKNARHAVLIRYPHALDE